MNTNTPCDHNSIMQLEQWDKITTQCTRCWKKIKVVKKPSCSCYGGFDCKICNPDYYEAVKPKLTRESYDENWNMKQTDTPTAEESSVLQTPLPSRRYTCVYCGSKGRRSNNPKQRLKEPICPRCHANCDDLVRLMEWQASCLERNSTDTPRTNKEAFAHFEGFCVSIAFARRLEIELTHSLQNQVKTQTEVESLRDAFSHLTNEIECTPKCSSHQAGYCDCGRLDRAYAIADLIAQNPTK